jgi:uncharacterized protein involved in cysteine biosynthesis
MFDAAFKALAQMFTAPFRGVLLKSAGLALALLAVLVIVFSRLLAWLTSTGEHWAEGALGAAAHDPLRLLGWLVAFALGSGLIAGAIVLMPAVTALVASFFTDEIAEKVEQSHYPLDPPGVIVPLPRALLEGLKAAALAVVVYVVCLPFVIFAGFGALLLFVANAWLLGRVYFDLAAMRFHPVAEAKMLRRMHGGTVFVAGLFIAGFVLIPIVNLATPLFGTALMIHMHKRLTRTRQAELLEPVRGGPR